MQEKSQRKKRFCPKICNLQVQLNLTLSNLLQHIIMKDNLDVRILTEPKLSYNEITKNQLCKEKSASADNLEYFF